MTKSASERARAYRDRLRGAPPHELAPCGTVAAMRRHERYGEPLDAACQAVRDERNAANYQARKAAAVEGGSTGETKRPKEIVGMVLTFVT